MLLDPPRTLPTGQLSASSVRLYLQCPEKWYRRNILNEWEPSSPAMLVGKAVGAAEAGNYQQKISSQVDLPVADVLDDYTDQFELAVDTARGGVSWGDEKPGAAKDSGVDVLRLYHRLTAPATRPVAVERKIVVHLPGVDWTFVGYPDLETADGNVDDLKVRGSSKGVVKPDEAASDPQVTGYLYGRRAEGQPASGFRYHNLVKARRLEPKHVQLTPTWRTGRELDQFQDTLFKIAAEINWRLENDVWTGAAPGSWWCSEKYCGFWRDCPYGSKFSAPVRLPQSAPARAVA